VNLKDKPLRQYSLIALFILAALIAGFFLLKPQSSSAPKTANSQSVIAEPNLPLAEYHSGDMGAAMKAFKSQPSQFRKQPMSRHFLAQVTALNGDDNDREDARKILTDLKATELTDNTQSVDVWLSVIDILDARAVNQEAAASSDALAIQALGAAQALFSKQNHTQALRLIEAVFALKPAASQDYKKAEKLYAKALAGTNNVGNEDLALVIYEKISETGDSSAIAELQAFKTAQFNKKFNTAYASALEDYTLKDYVSAKQKLEFLLEGQESFQTLGQSQAIRQLYGQTLMVFEDQASLLEAEAIFSKLQNEGVEAADIWLGVLQTKVQSKTQSEKYSNALQLYKDKDIAASLVLLDEILNDAPEYQPATALRAQIYAQSNNSEFLEIAIEHFRSEDKILNPTQIAWMDVVLRQKFKNYTWPEILSSLGPTTSLYEFDEISGKLLTEGIRTSEISQGLRVFTRRAVIANQTHTEGFEGLSALNLNLSCHHFKRAIREEKRTLRDLDVAAPVVPKCKNANIAKETTEILFSRLYDAVTTLRENNLDMAMFDANGDSAVSLERAFNIVPPGYAKPFSIVSDADSQIIEDTQKHIEILQEQLGLPVSTSLFVVNPTFAATNREDINRFPTSIFFSAVNGQGVFGSDGGVANILHDWYDGFYDHYHG